jgi:hypothetical protein
VAAPTLRPDYPVGRPQAGAGRPFLVTDTADILDDVFGDLAGGESPPNGLDGALSRPLPL